MNNILTTTTAMTHGLILKDNFWIFFQIFSSFGVRDWSALDLRNGLKFNPFRAKATLNVVCPLKLLAFATERLSLLFRCLTTLWKGTYREVSQGEVSRWNLIAGNVPIVVIISTLLHPNLLREHWAFVVQHNTLSRTLLSKPNSRFHHSLPATLLLQEDNSTLVRFKSIIKHRFNGWLVSGSKCWQIKLNPIFFIFNGLKLLLNYHSNKNFCLICVILKRYVKRSQGVNKSNIYYINIPCRPHSRLC